MAEKVTLRSMKCPTCGASLKAENSTDAIVCVYCGNTIVPVFENTAAPSAGESAGFSGTVRVEGIKTSSSALAYIEQFFEDYDWEAFAYAQTLSVSEIDGLVASLKQSSADDKNTWFACFKAAYVPFVRKLEGCRIILDAVIEEYKKDNLDSYSLFDAYKRITTMMLTDRDDVAANLEKYITTAVKYGATDEEAAALRSDLTALINSEIEFYREIDSIPDIRTFKAAKNARIVAELAAQGINAADEYQRAQALIAQKQYVEALTILCALKGYADTDELIHKLDRYYLVDDVLEIEGVLYFFRKNADDSGAYSLHRTEGGKIDKKPFIQDIANIITNYADILYYINSGNKLCRCHLSTGVIEVIGKTHYETNDVYMHRRKVYLVASQSRNLVELELSTGVATTLKEVVSKILYFKDKKLVYDKRMEIGDSFYQTTCVMDMETYQVTPVGAGVKVEGFVNNHVVYTVPSPNNNNLHLYAKELSPNAQPVLVEPNIYRFCDIIAGKLFYYIGNSSNQCLIHVDPDGSKRREWPLYIHKVLFEQGGWVYFIRRSGYNSILCKSHLDGGNFSVIARDIDEFIEIKNGYLYYLNDDAALVKVRMDGSNLQTLCDDVEKVLTVKEDKIVFVSVDDRISRGFGEFATTKNVKSIYSVDFGGAGKRKLVYDVDLVKEYDDDHVYFMVENRSPEVAVTQEMYRLNINSYRVDKLLDVETIEVKAYGWIVALIIFLLALVASLISFGNENTMVALISMIVAFVSFIILLACKKRK